MLSKVLALLFSKSRVVLHIHDLISSLKQRKANKQGEDQKLLSTLSSKQKKPHKVLWQYTSS